MERRARTRFRMDLPYRPYQGTVASILRTAERLDRAGWRRVYPAHEQAGFPRMA